MSFIKRWFSKKEPEDYEQVLSSLAMDISKRQTRLSEMRLRERRMTLVLTIYAFAAWGAYVALWYSGWLYIPGTNSGRIDDFGRHTESGLQKFFKGVPIVVGPILIQFTRRIVQLWYTRKENVEEKSLKSLLAKQRSTVEEIKKKTNYYSTKSLLEKYENLAPATPQRTTARRDGGPQQPPQPPPSVGGTPMRPVPGQFSQQRPQRQGQGQGQVNGGMQHDPTSSFINQTPLPPPKKMWYDKVADALLGDDERVEGKNDRMNRYALICRKCYNHNGLARDSEFESVQYVCPKCGFFNASLRSLKEANLTSSQTAPNSPLSPSSQSQFVPTSPTSPSPAPSSSTRPDRGQRHVLERQKGERRKSGLSKTVVVADEDEDEESGNKNPRNEKEERRDESKEEQEESEEGNSTILMEVDG